MFEAAHLCVSRRVAEWARRTAVSKNCIYTPIDSSQSSTCPRMQKFSAVPAVLQGRGRVHISQAVLDFRKTHSPKLHLLVAYPDAKAGANFQTGTADNPHLYCPVIPSSLYLQPPSHHPSIPTAHLSPSPASPCHRTPCPRISTSHQRLPNRPVPISASSYIPPVYTSAPTKMVQVKAGLTAPSVQPHLVEARAGALRVISGGRTNIAP